MSLNHTRFAQHWGRVGSVGHFPEEVVRGETQLFQADLKFALTHGGPITRAFVEGLVSMAADGWIIDSRVHMLMPGMWPAIPGWHLDAVPRTLPNNQPNIWLQSGVGHIDHFMCVVGPTAMTSFLAPGVEITIPRLSHRQLAFGRRVYGYCDELITVLDPPTVNVSSGDVVHFTSRDFHRANPADRHGWRFFIRASRGVAVEPKNEIRTQTQAYLNAANFGW